MEEGEKQRDFENHASSPIRKERLSPTSKARREVSGNNIVEKSEMPGGVKSLRKGHGSNDRARALLVC